MKKLLFTFPGQERRALAIAASAGLEQQSFETRRFPDGETYLRVGDGIRGAEVAVLCSLDRPDGKFLPLYFLSETLRELGAHRVGLICPYLSYMRQDKRFLFGEALTSNAFAKLLSRSFDWLVTVDPHLHRHKSLKEIYAIPTRVLHAGDDIVGWIKANVVNPVIVGPDEESAQWVSAVAKKLNRPYIVLDKIRRGDQDVAVSEIGDWRHDATPVILDDIVSSGKTMLETVKNLLAVGAKPPVCIGIHAVFSEGAYEELMRAGALQVVTCDTIMHATNHIDLAQTIGTAVKELIEEVDL